MLIPTHPHEEITMKTYFIVPIMLIVALATTLAYADNDKKHGLTYGELSVKWQQWALAGPKGANAVEDETGDFCAAHQPKNNIWFLAGSFGKTGIVRKCTIPAKRALFYPIIEGGWIDCPGSADESVSDADVRNIIAAGVAGDGASLLTSTLDGVAVSSLQIPTARVQSPKFKVNLPLNHILGDAGCGFILPTGKTGRLIIDGYWVKLPPLTPGNHVITLHGASGDSTGRSFENEVTYNLTVLK